MKRIIRGVLRGLIALAGFASTLVHASYEEAFAAIQQKDYAKAVPLLNAAAEKNDPRAFNALGILHLQGFGVSKDERAAVQWLERAANAGNLNAMNGLASLYSRGTADTPKNLPMAREWTWKASLANDANAQFNYAQMAAVNELSKLDAAGRISKEKYMALARRTMAERELDQKAYTMLSRSAEQGHFGAMLVAMGVMNDNVGPNNVQRSLDLIAKLPMSRLPPNIVKMVEASKASNTFLKSLGQTYVTGSVFKDTFVTALLSAYVKANVQPATCDAKNVRVVKASITRELNQPTFLPVEAALLKDVVLVRGDWQETWVIDVCGTAVEVPLEFQADGGGGVYFQTQQKMNSGGASEG